MLSGRPAGAAGQHKALFQIPRQGHYRSKHGQRGGLAPQDAGAKAHRSGTGLCGHLGFLGGKAALGSGHDGGFQLFPLRGRFWRRPAGRAGARRRTRSRTAQGRTVQRCGTRHQSLPAAGPHPAERPGRTAWRLPPQCGCSARSSAPLFLARPRNTG